MRLPLQDVVDALEQGDDYEGPRAAHRSRAGGNKRNHEYVASVAVGLYRIADGTASSKVETKVRNVVAAASAAPAHSNGKRTAAVNGK